MGEDLGEVFFTPLSPTFVGFFVCGMMGRDDSEY